MFLSDRRRREDRFLEWKVRLFSVSAVLGLAGIYLDERWMTGGAIVVLCGAVFLRFLPGGGRGSLYGDDDELEEDAAEGEDTAGSG